MFMFQVFIFKIVILISKEKENCIYIVLQIISKGNDQVAMTSKFESREDIGLYLLCSQSL